MRVLQYTIIDVRVNDVNEGIIYESSKFEIFTRKDDKILISVQQLKVQIALVSIMSKLYGMECEKRMCTVSKDSAELLCVNMKHQLNLV